MGGGRLGTTLEEQDSVKQHLQMNPNAHFIIYLSINIAPEGVWDLLGSSYSNGFIIKIWNGTFFIYFVQF